MPNYILSGWGNKDLWVLNNATWVTWGGENCLLTGNDITKGSGFREFNNILNQDWKFTIAYAIKVTPEEMRCAEIDFYLDGDSNPIEFHHSKDEPEEGQQTLLIIYNGIKASKTIPMDEYDYTTEIYRIGSVYYYTSYGLSFDYGSIKKPVKLRLTGHLWNFSTYWYALRWWYTEVAEEDYAFIM